MTSRSFVRLAFGAMALVLVASCAKGDNQYPESRRKGETAPTYGERETVFGEGGINFFGSDSAKPAGTAGPGIGVNSYLWRASLDTISFMPLSSADPFGGVIITDWYTPPEIRRERFKVNVYILGRDLRADGLRAAVFRQRQDFLGNWVDAEVDQQTAIDLEDAILTRARQLRIAAVE